jgi:hypothetical protein
MEAVLYEKRFDTTTTTEVTEDFTLPDYRPEIRRVLGVRGQAVVDGKYLAGEELEADGSVTYTVVYLDGDGLLYEESETSPFNVRIPVRSELSGGGEDRFGTGDLILSADAESVNCRVTGPRRLSLSSRVRLTLLSQKPTDFALEAGGIGSIRRKLTAVKTGVMAQTRGSFTCTGEIREKDGRVAGAQGSVCVTDARVSGDRLVFRGDAMVTVLLAREAAGGEEYLITRGRAQVEESVSLPGGEEKAAGTWHAAVFPKVLLTELETDPASGLIRWRMEYDADAALIRAGEGEVTADAYSPDAETDAEEKNCLSLSPAAVLNGRLTLTGRMRTERGADFVTAWGTADPGRCAVQGGKAQTAGTVRLTLVTGKGGELTSDELILPLKYEWEALCDAADSEDAGVTGRVEAGVAEITARPSESDGGTEWSVTAEVWIAAALLSSRPVTGVVKLTPKGEGGAFRKDVIRVYIPEPDETSWDVEKRFRLPGPAEVSDGVYVI